MSSEMDWALDFCLYCDRQTNTEGPYCSQACRLADIEKPGFSSSSFSIPASHSHSHSSTSSHQKTHWSPTTNQSLQFNLPPAFNFESYRHRSASKIESPPLSPKNTSSKHRSPATSSRPTLSSKSSDYYYQQQQQQYQQYQQQRSLNSSSSRSSLSSVSSANSIQGISEQALTQLQGYSNAFDHLRDSRRRVTLG